MRSDLLSLRWIFGLGDFLSKANFVAVFTDADSSFKPASLLGILVLTLFITIARFASLRNKPTDAYLLAVFAGCVAIIIIVVLFQRLAPLVAGDKSVRANLIVDVIYAQIVLSLVLFMHNFIPGLSIIPFLEKNAPDLTGLIDTIPGAVNFLIGWPPSGADTSGRWMLVQQLDVTLFNLLLASIYAAATMFWLLFRTDPWVHRYARANPDSFKTEKHKIYRLLYWNMATSTIVTTTVMFLFVTDETDRAVSYTINMSIVLKVLGIKF